MHESDVKHSPAWCCLTPYWTHAIQTSFHANKQHILTPHTPAVYSAITPQHDNYRHQELVKRHAEASLSRSICGPRCIRKKKCWKNTRRRGVSVVHQSCTLRSRTTTAVLDILLLALQHKHGFIATYIQYGTWPPENESHKQKLPTLSTSSVHHHMMVISWPHFPTQGILSIVDVFGKRTTFITPFFHQPISDQFLPERTIPGLPKGEWFVEY